MCCKNFLGKEFDKFVLRIFEIRFIHFCFLFLSSVKFLKIVFSIHCLRIICEKFQIATAEQKTIKVDHYCNDK